MKPTATDNQKDNTEATCRADGKDCGCSNGLCPGVILGIVVLVGWGLYAAATWVWTLIVG